MELTHGLYEYILETSVYPRDPEPLKEIRALTASHPRALMVTAPDAGQIIGLLLKLVGARKTIEIGFLRIVAIDISREYYEIGRPVIKNAGVEHKIDFIESEGLPALDKILENVHFRQFFINY
ncbi:putative class I-like SAM-dependent O-methyltransferase [Helianthus annuus]|nr:putative class I-like SAM-dependent O-methyltransferase [Helianthus annuus]